MRDCSTLRDLAETPIYEPAAAAMAHVATFMNHGAAAIADDGARGARGFRPFAQRASAAPRDLVPHLWSRRLQYCESVDAHLRRHLLTSRAAPELKAWLSAWADVVDALGLYICM